MIPKYLDRGDKIAIVSLSSGILGMPYCRHELELGLSRLREFGLEPVIMDNALAGVDYLKEHPEKRAADLKQAFLDDSIKAVMTAIGGDDTYRTIPYLFEDTEFVRAVREHPKIFTGFSDTTINHIMLNRLGLSTFYGPCFIADIAELDAEMLPYTREYFEKYFSDGAGYEIKSSPVWYDDRESFGPEQLGVPRVRHTETRGFETLHGGGKVTGKLYGGCIESIYDAFTGATYENEPAVCEKYGIFPTMDEWGEKILFLETSELKTAPDAFEKMLYELKRRGILGAVKGVIAGKPADETYYEEYKDVYKKVFYDIDTPVMYNVNFGHALPRCVLPYDAETTVDYDEKRIVITSRVLF